MTVPGRTSTGAELSAYICRYLRADGVFARVTEMRCASDSEALHRAADEHRDYAALEITCGPRLVWCGLREDATGAAVA